MLQRPVSIPQVQIEEAGLSSAIEDECIAACERERERGGREGGRYSSKRLFQHEYPSLVGGEEFEEMEGGIRCPCGVRINRYLGERITQ